MNRFRRPARACRSFAAATRLLRVVRELRRHLERAPPVDAVSALVDGEEEVGGPLEVLDRELEEERLAAEARRRLLADRVVVVARSDRLVEDRRVRSQAGDRVPIDVALHDAVVEHGPGDVVEPQALTLVVECLCCLHARSFSAATRSTRDLRYTVGCEPELLQEMLQRSGRTERVHSDDRPTVTHIAVPPQSRCLLDADPRPHGRRQHFVAVLPRLAVEQLPTRHAHHARLDATRRELIARRQREVHLRPRRQQDHIGLAVRRVGEHVGPLRDTRGRREDRPIEGRQVLPRQDHRGRLIVELDEDPPGLDDLVRVGRSEDEEAGHGTERRQLLHGLMRRPVFADADRVVREDVHDGDLHQGGQADRPTGVVREDQESRPVRPQLRERHAVRDRCGRVLAHPEVQVASGPALGLEAARALERQVRLRRRGKVGGTAYDPRDRLRNGVQHLARRVAAGVALGVGRERRQRVLPADRQVATLDAVELVGELGMLRAVSGEQLVPRVASSFSPRADALREVVVHTVGDVEVLVLREVEESLRRLDTLDSERLAVGLGRVLHGRAVPDVAVHHDDRRSITFRSERVERALDRLEVVRVRDGRDVPAVGHEPRRDIFGERDVRVAFDRHAVRVVDPAQVRQSLMSGERRRLGRDAFHHAAVARERVHVEVEEVEALAVVASGEPLTGNRHAHRRRNALAERTCRRLDSTRPAILRMTGATRVELAEGLQIVE